MRKSRKQALTKLTGELRENVKVESSGIDDYLLALGTPDCLGFLNAPEKEAVMSKTANRDKVGEIIKILLGKSDADFVNFCEILKKCGYGPWSERLNMEAERFRATSGKCCVHVMLSFIAFNNFII